MFFYFVICAPSAALGHQRFWRQSDTETLMSVFTTRLCLFLHISEKYVL